MTQGSDYPGGSLYQLRSDLTVFTSSSVDVGFRSYVDTASAVPEPASWALLGMGMAGVGAMLRRRQHRAAAA